MAALTLGWEYLTGYAVATDPSHRERPEWPPHPARVFMALAAAWFETGEDPEEGAALRWLESLDDEPELHLPPADAVFPRSLVTVYVPVNDKAGPSAAMVQSAPALTRNRQARSFPRVWVGHDPCYLRWPEVADDEGLRGALDRLCQKVTRIGHSSSLVRMWAGEMPDDGASSGETWRPDATLADFQARRTSPGMLDMLIDRFGEAPRLRHAELSDEIERLKAEKKVTKGEGAKERKVEIDRAMAEKSTERDALVVQAPVRPSIGLWSGYRRGAAATARSIAASNYFDTDMLVLARVEGPDLPLTATLAVAQALRETIMKHSPVQPVPAWISGHEPNGEPLRDHNGHLAIAPLAFVGSPHADGQLMGVGLALPRSIDRAERGRVLGPVLLDKERQPKRIPLKLGRLGVWDVQLRDWSERRQTLQPETWTAHPAGANTWASVTPVVLDRFPKPNRLDDRVAWSVEVAAIVRDACTRIGLPRPIEVDLDTTSWHAGCPRAIVKRRSLRGHESTEAEQQAALGDGFPPYPAKSGSASRPQVHVWLRFAEPVLGPILLGAGRYRGYGLLKPWKGDQR